MSKSENTMHDANRKGWDAVSAKWQANIDARMDWRRVPENIRLVLDEEELGYLGDVSGRSACVLGSGDNLVAFALAGAGAKVTSVDISGTQLDVAAERAKEIGLSIQFHRADVTDLHELRDDAFDLVYTGGHVAVWVSDRVRPVGGLARRRIRSVAQLRVPLDDRGHDMRHARRRIRTPGTEGVR